LIGQDLQSIHQLELHGPCVAWKKYGGTQLCQSKQSGNCSCEKIDLYSPQVKDNYLQRAYVELVIPIFSISSRLVKPFYEVVVLLKLECLNKVKGLAKKGQGLEAISQEL
jgi:hypothetical protein